MCHGESHTCRLRRGNHARAKNDVVEQALRLERQPSKLEGEGCGALLGAGAEGGLGVIAVVVEAQTVGTGEAMLRV